MTDDVLDYSGAPQPSVGDQREHGFKIMKAHMMAEVQKKLSHVPPLMRGTALHWYAKAVDDSFNVFRQIVERPSDEEIQPG